MQILPNLYNKLINASGCLIDPWIQYLAQFTTAPPNIKDVDVDASPSSYVAQEPGTIHIIGGTVSAIALIRGLITLDVTGSRLIPVGIMDTVRVTYTVVPTIKFIPAYGYHTDN